jgi:hypothetical protein
LITRVNNFDLSYDDLGEGIVPIIFCMGFPSVSKCGRLSLIF